MRDVVVVGASLAGLRAAEALREGGYQGSLIVLGSEKELPYDRPPLSKGFLLSDGEPGSLVLRGVPELDVQWRLATSAVSVDVSQRQLELSDGDTLRYGGLVLATGSTPRVLPGLDLSLKGVHVLRTVHDAAVLRDELHASPRRVVVLGAGFIGGELTSTCLQLGIPVTLVDPSPMPLERPLGAVVASVLAARHRDRGTDLRTGVSVTALVGHGRVEAVELSDGSLLQADVVVVAVGARPVVDWLAGSGIAVADGVLCDAGMASTSTPDVVAAGDVARFQHPRFGSLRVEHWTSAVETARTAARTLLDGPGVHTHLDVPSFWTDVLGIKIQGIGALGTADRVTIDDPGAPDGLGDGMVASYWLGPTRVGAVAFGRPRALLPYRRELAEPVSAAV